MAYQSDFVATVGNQATTIISPAALRVGGTLLRLRNNSVADTIWVSLSGTAAANAVGSTAILPGTAVELGSVNPNSGLSAVSTGSSTSLSVANY